MMSDPVWLREWLGISQQPMSFPPQELVARFFELLQRKPQLIPPCHWMLLGPDLCRGALGMSARPPTEMDFVQLRKLLQKQDEELFLLSQWLITQHQQQMPALVFQQRAARQVGQLLRVDPEQWSHPVQVLDRPLASLWELIQECRLRLLSAPEDKFYRARLRQILANLDHLVQLGENAARRRKEMRQQARFESTAHS